MALRGNSGNIAIAVAGTTVAHGLTVTPGGAAIAPSEYWVTPTIPLGAGQVYRYAAPDSTNVYFASGTSATSGIIFYSYPWSAIA